MSQECLPLFPWICAQNDCSLLGQSCMVVLLLSIASLVACSLHPPWAYPR